MKVPSLKDEDLYKIHAFENTEGNTVNATFVSADDHKVVITLSNNPNRLIPMTGINSVPNHRHFLKP